MMIIRSVGLYLKYLITKYKLRDKVSFKGFSIVYAFSGSSITFAEIENGLGKITIYSDFLSNLVGLYQRSIIIARYGGKIKIGSGCGISGSTIYSTDEITIGRNTIVGANCKIIDNDFHPLDSSKWVHQVPEDVKKEPVHIGEGCFIGTNSIILKGTIIGNHCIVGAGSVVSGEFPDNVIIAGNPAKVIKENII